MESVFLVILQAGDLIEPILEGAKETGGGWAVYVLLIVIGVIAYFVGLWLTLKNKSDERRDAARKAEYDQRLASRMADFEAQLERERMNTASHKEMTASVIRVVEDNTKAITEFSITQRESIGLMRPMGESIGRIEKYIEQQSFPGRGTR